MMHLSILLAAILASPIVVIAFSGPATPRLPTALCHARKNNLEHGEKGLEDLVSDICQATNNFWAGLVIKPVKDYVQLQEGGTAGSDPYSKLIAPPELPGIPRPLWLTILGSVPTALGWYGYYKFSVEEELYQHELQTEGKVSGFGGYGTLFPFVYGILVGYPLAFLHIPGGQSLVEFSGIWILVSQVNLYRRVNELCMEFPDKLGLDGPPLHAWWAILPPPIDVIVGLRQVHFLSEYWRIQREEDSTPDLLEDILTKQMFPFISSNRFTLKELFREPSRWFWFTKNWPDFESSFLQERSLQQEKSTSKSSSQNDQQSLTSTKTKQPTRTDEAWWETSVGNA